MYLLIPAVALWLLLGDFHCINNTIESVTGLGIYMIKQFPNLGINVNNYNTLTTEPKDPDANLLNSKNSS